MNLFQIGVASVNDGCHGLLPLVRIIRNGIFPIVQIGIPIVLIVFGTVDLGKAVISSDDKQVKEAQGRLIKRCIYAVAIFFIVTLVSIVMNLVSVAQDKNIEKKDVKGWSNCWDAAK